MMKANGMTNQIHKWLQYLPLKDRQWEGSAQMKQKCSLVACIQNWQWRLLRLNWEACTVPWIDSFWRDNDDTAAEWTKEMEGLYDTTVTAVLDDYWRIIFISRWYSEMFSLLEKWILGKMKNFEFGNLRILFLTVQKHIALYLRKFNTHLISYRKEYTKK